MTTLATGGCFFSSSGKSKKLLLSSSLYFFFNSLSKDFLRLLKLKVLEIGALPQPPSLTQPSPRDCPCSSERPGTDGFSACFACLGQVHLQRKMVDFVQI